MILEEKSSLNALINGKNNMVGRSLFNSRGSDHLLTGVVKYLQWMLKEPKHIMKLLSVFLKRNSSIETTDL